MCQCAAKKNVYNVISSEIIRSGATTRKCKLIIRNIEYYKTTKTSFERKKSESIVLLNKQDIICFVGSSVPGRFVKECELNLNS